MALSCLPIRARKPRPLRKRSRHQTHALRRAVLESLEDRRLLAVTTVNSTSDVDDGDTSSIASLIAAPGPDGVISLREAITAANNTGGADTVELPAGTFTLTLVGANENDNATGDLDVSDELTIVGDDSENTIIDASGLDPDGAGDLFGDRVFHVHGVVFKLQNVTIARGNVAGGDGGGLLNDQGSVTLTDVIVDGNATTASGGGLATFGSALIPVTLTLDHVRVANNQAVTGGGGVYSRNDTLNVISTEIHDNRSQGSGGGIEIVADAIRGTTLNMANSSVSGNVADVEGGGIAGFGEMLNIRDSLINDNTAIGSGGGILNNDGDLNLLRSTIDNNNAGVDGGGIFNVLGTSDIAETTLSINQAGEDGGAISNFSGTVNIRNSTVSGNTAADDGEGGGIQNSGTVSLLNTTITANQAGHGAGLDIASGANTLLGNSIVAGNTNIETTLPGDIFGTLNSTSSSNLIGDGSNLSGISNGTDGNQIGTAETPIDPLLGPLEFNGGPNFTHLPLTGSPSIDAGDNSIAPPIDQRGGHRPRPIAGDVDIGAVELQTGCSTEVTTPADTFDATDGETSLREAIICANLTTGPDNITFNIPSAGVQTINVGSTGLGPLPDITGAVTIDGYTQGGTPNSDPLAFNGQLLIEINGTDAGEIANGLEILAGSSTVRGLVINRFRSQRIGDETFGGNAIVLTGLGGNLIEGNVLGTDPDGAIDLGNESAGILIDGPSNNTIGGITPAARNLISGNLVGIEIEDGSTGNTVLGNLIGTNAAGTASLSASSAGIGIFESSNNTIGGITASARNLISGNGVGIFVIEDELPATGNMLLGNYIGTDLTGVSEVNDVGNDIGILISASGNIVGGSSAEARNVISDNNVTGLWIIDEFSTAVTGNLVQGNFIGTDASDGKPLPNGGGDYANIAARLNQVILETTGESANVTAAGLAEVAGGVAISRTSANTIGGTVPGAGNVISGNDGAGVILANTAGNIIQGNFIGTDVTATLDRHNNDAGVHIVNGSNNSITDNVIAFNSQLTAGTGVDLVSGTGNLIQRNSMFSNIGLGIDLGSDGVTPNDPGDADAGPNNLQNFPEFTQAVVDNGDLTLTYQVPSLAPNSSFPIRVELFLADADGQEGKQFFGADSYAETDGSKTVTITPQIPVNLGDRIVGTATDASGNTSEFSADAITVQLGQCSLTVTNTTDGGPGSLREAIICANSMAGPNTISVPAGTYLLDLMGVDEDAAAAGDLDITEELMLIGASGDPADVIIDASGLDPDGTGPEFGDRVFHVHGVEVEFNGITITGGTAPSSKDGGGILISDGDVRLINSAVSNNVAARGGGIFNEATSPNATLTLVNTVVRGNRAIGGPNSIAQGGGIASINDTVNINAGSLITENVADSGGLSVFSGAAQGGGLFLSGGSLTITDSQVDFNDAVGRTAAIPQAAATGTGAVRLSILDIGQQGPVLPANLQLTASADQLGLNPDPDNFGNGSFVPGGSASVSGTNPTGDLFDYQADVQADITSLLTVTASPLGKYGGADDALGNIGIVNRDEGPYTMVMAADYSYSLTASRDNPATETAEAEVQLFVSPTLPATLVDCPGGEMAGRSIELAVVRIDTMAGDAEASQASQRCTFSITVPPNPPDQVVIHSVGTSALVIAGAEDTGPVVVGDADGGGIFLNALDGPALITNSSVDGNQALAADQTPPESPGHGNGGGIYADFSAVTITDSRVANNLAEGAGGGVLSNDNIATLEIIRSTVSGNTAASTGGGIDNSGTLDITNSTVSGNTAGTRGGGIHVPTRAMLTSVNNTIVENVVGISDVITPLNGGGIFSEGTTLLHNTILVGNKDVENTPTEYGGGAAADPASSFNLIGIDMGMLFGIEDGVNGNQYVADALLGPLQDNGGPTFTHALQIGSPAIDAADTALAPSNDQRGVARPNGPAADIGAYETVTVAELVADLSLDKQADKSSAKPGETVTFTVALTNIGPDAATGIQVADAIPAGLTSVIVTPSGTTSFTNGVWSIGSLAASELETLTITGEVVEGGTTITNTVEVTAADQADPVSTNNVASATVTVAELVADLSLDKQADKSSAKPGETVTFTVALTNIGPDAATGIQVADAIPAGLTSVVVTPSGTTSYAGGVWSIGSLAASGMETLTITGEVVANGTTITNTAEVTAADQADPVSTNNVASATVTVVELVADLSLSKVVDNARPNVGDEVTFTVTLNNQGPDPATGIVVTDVLPAGLMFRGSSTNNYDAATGQWTVAALAVDQTETLMITALITAAGTATNLAEVTATDQFDPDPGDNHAAVIVTPQVADLSLVKTVDDSSATIGQEVTFTVAVNNSGPDAATNVTVTDKLPEGLEFVSAITEAGNYNNDSGIWRIGQLSADATVTLEIVATLASEDPITNVAQVATSDQFDPDSTPGNNVQDEDDQFSASVGACLTGGPLTIGMNRLVYSCVTPGGFAAFVMGTQPGNHFYDRWKATVDIADPSVLAIGVGNIDGVATVLLEITEAHLNQELIFQAFEMLPNRNFSNTLTLQAADELLGIALRAAEVGAGGAALSVDSLPALTAEAITRWEATGLSVSDSQLIRSLDVRISDLPGDQLAASHGNFVLLDSTAAGNGWFVDVTPDDDAEFSSDANGELAATSPPASDHIDALTVLMHEIGHALDQDDTGELADLMFRQLPTGIRRLPTSIYDPLDANRDGKVSALDALVIINRLATNQATGETFTEGHDQVLQGYDVNDDDRVSTLDALQVINALSQAVLTTEAESEQDSAPVSLMPSLPMLTASTNSLDDSLLQMLADDNLSARLT